MEVVDVVVVDDDDDDEDDDDDDGGSGGCYGLLLRKCAPFKKEHHLPKIPSVSFQPLDFRVAGIPSCEPGFRGFPSQPVSKAAF